MLIDQAAACGIQVLPVVDKLDDPIMLGLVEEAVKIGQARLQRESEAAK